MRVTGEIEIHGIRSRFELDTSKTEGRQDGYVNLSGVSNMGKPVSRASCDEIEQALRRALQPVLGHDKAVTQMHVHEARRRTLDPAIPITVIEEA
jgi:hypothetical protein